jgi:hypothetical protein
VPPRAGPDTVVPGRLRAGATAGSGRLDAFLAGMARNRRRPPGKRLAVRHGGSGRLPWRRCDRPPGATGAVTRRPATRCIWRQRYWPPPRFHRPAGRRLPAAELPGSKQLSEIVGSRAGHHSDGPVRIAVRPTSHDAERLLTYRSSSNSRQSPQTTTDIAAATRRSRCGTAGAARPTCPTYLGNPPDRLAFQQVGGLSRPIDGGRAGRLRWHRGRIPNTVAGTLHSAGFLPIATESGEGSGVPSCSLRCVINAADACQPHSGLLHSEKPSPGLGGTTPGAVRIEYLNRRLVR